MTLSTETIDRLEAQAKALQGKQIKTGVIVMPGQLLELIRAYRLLLEGAAHPVYVVDMTTNRIALLSDANGELPK